MARTALGLRNLQGFAHQRFEPVLAERAEEAVEHVALAGHRLGYDDVRLANRGALVPGDAEVIERPLSAHPEGQGRDLGAAGVDINAVEVVAEDQSRDRRVDRFQRRVIVAERLPGGLRFRAAIIFPGFHIDGDQEIEAIKQEMARAAGGVQDPDIARVLPEAVGNENRLSQQFFLRQALMAFRGRRRSFALGEKDLVRSSNHVTALFAELRASLPHLVPGAAQRIIGEELNDISGREELVADGQLAAVARGGGGVAHGAALVLAVEILVDPADRLVLAPDARQLRSVEDIQQVEQGLPARPEQRGRVAAVEQHLDLGPQLVEQAFQVELIALVGEVGKAGGQAGEFLEAAGLVPLGDAVLDQATGFEHLERGEPVQERERGLAAVVVDRLDVGLAGLLGAVVRDGLDDLATDQPLPVVEVRTGLGEDAAVGQDVEGALQLRRELGLQEPPGVLGRALQVVASRLVHCLNQGRRKRRDLTTKYTKNTKILIQLRIVLNYPMLRRIKGGEGGRVYILATIAPQVLFQ